jgi:hypothetical protein
VAGGEAEAAFCVSDVGFLFDLLVLVSSLSLLEHEGQGGLDMSRIIGKCHLLPVPLSQTSIPHHP